MSKSIRNLTPLQLHQSEMIATAGGFLAAATDIFIAASMFFLLWKQRGGRKESDRMISLLLILTVNTGFWSAVTALAAIITLLVLPSPSLTGGALLWILCPVYCNAVLGNLNGRAFIHQRGRPGTFALPTDLVIDFSTGEGSTGSEVSSFRRRYRYG